MSTTRLEGAFLIRGRRREPGQLIKCSDYVIGWTVRTSSPGGSKRIFSSQKRPDRLWGTRVAGYQGSFSGVNWPGRDVAHSHLAPRLRMSGAIPLLPLVDRDEFSYFPFTVTWKELMTGISDNRRKKKDVRRIKYRREESK